MIRCQAVTITCAQGEVAAPSAADQPCGGVQNPVAQGLGLGLGQAAVEGKQLEPGERGGGGQGRGQPGLVEGERGGGELGRFVKPFRADRRYLDDYRADLRDVVDLMCQLQIYLDPRAVECVRPWADVAEGRDIADIPSLPDGSLRTYPTSRAATGSPPPLRTRPAAPAPARRPRPPPRNARPAPTARPERPEAPRPRRLHMYLPCTRAGRRARSRRVGLLGQVHQGADLRRYTPGTKDHRRCTGSAPEVHRTCRDLAKMSVQVGFVGRVAVFP
jgi:hypothetical protein